MALRALGSLLNRTLKRHGITNDVTAALAIEVMERAIEARWGKTGKRGIQVRYLRNNAIYFSCTSSVLAQEVRLNEKSLLRAVRDKIGETMKIETIKFVA